MRESQASDARFAYSGSVPLFLKSSALTLIASVATSSSAKPGILACNEYALCQSSPSTSFPERFGSSTLNLKLLFGDSLLAVTIFVATGEATEAAEAACYCCNVTATINDINASNCFIRASSDMLKIC